jgi:hypothetical protein
MASPHVAGLVALYIAANGRATNAAGVQRIRQAIVNSALPQFQWGPADTEDPDGNPEPMARVSESWVPQPNIGSWAMTPACVQFSFPVVPGYTYQPQYAEQLNPPIWNNLGLAIVTTNGSTVVQSVTDTNVADIARFYRVNRWPSP